MPRVVDVGWSHCLLSFLSLSLRLLLFSVNVTWVSFAHSSVYFHLHCTVTMVTACCLFSIQSLRNVVGFFFFFVVLIYLFESQENGACVHYVMVSKIQWQPFWLATQLYPQNDWTGWQIRVNYRKTPKISTPSIFTEICCRLQCPESTYPQNISTLYPVSWKCVHKRWNKHNSVVFTESISKISRSWAHLALFCAVKAALNI